MNREMTINDLVSIVIPVYNTPSSMLRRLNAAIMRQTYKNIETVFVDDGSQQETAKCLDDCAIELDNAKIANQVIHQKNGGVSKARNIGKMNAKGKWIAFVDADDVIADQYIELLLRTALEYKAKVAVCSFKKVISEHNIKFDSCEDIKTKLVCGADVWRNINTGYATDKLYYSEVVEKIDFDESKQLAEDYLFVNQVFEMYPKAAIVDCTLYWQIVNPYSATCLLDSQKCKQALDVYSYGLSISYITSNNDLMCARKRGLLVWYLRYLEAVISEQGFKGSEEFKKIRNAINDILRDVGNIKNVGLYQKVAILVITKVPKNIGIILLKEIHRIRMLRLYYRRRKVSA